MPSPHTLPEVIKEQQQAIASGAGDPEADRAQGQIVIVVITNGKERQLKVIWS